MPIKYIFEVEEANEYKAHIKRVTQIRDRKVDNVSREKNIRRILREKHAIHSRVRAQQTESANREITFENNRLAKTLTFMKSCQQSKYNDCRIESKYAQRKRNWDNKLNFENYYIGKRLLDTASTLHQQKLAQDYKDRVRMRKHLKFITARPPIVEEKGRVCRHELTEEEKTKFKVRSRGSRFLVFSIHGLTLDKTKLEDSPENLFCLEKRTGYVKATEFFAIGDLTERQFVFQVPREELLEGKEFTFALMNDRQGNLIQTCNFTAEFNEGEMKHQSLFSYKSGAENGLIELTATVKRCKRKEPRNTTASRSPSSMYKFLRKIRSVDRSRPRPPHERSLQ